MTGPIDWETAQWLIGIILAILGAAVATGTVLWRWQAWLAREFQRRDELRQTEFAKRDEATELLRRSLEAHKLYAAETFATKEGLTEAFDRVHDDLDKISDRLDSLTKILLDGRPPTRRA